MSARSAPEDRPGRLLRGALRAPNLVYRLGAGRLLGHRFLQLTHRGRRSGRLYETVLEVVRWSSAEREVVVMSGFGPGAQWYRNARAGGALQVRIGAERFAPTVRSLAEVEAAEALAGYESRNRLAAPVVRAVLSQLAGFRYDGSPEARAELVRRLPLIAMRPSV